MDKTKTRAALSTLMALKAKYSFELINEIGLNDGKYNGQTLSEATGYKQPTISQVTGRLIRSNIILVKRDGALKYFHINWNKLNNVAKAVKELQ